MITPASRIGIAHPALRPTWHGPFFQRLRQSRWFGLAFALILLGGLPSPALAHDAVTLQLKWSHAFQFAGYYAAKAKGYYGEAGLDVSILPALPGDDVLKAVTSGKAQYGVGTSSLLLARNAGKPVVALAAIFQHSPLVLISRQDSGTQGIHDLLGKRVMIEPHSDELLAYLKQEGIPFDGFTHLEHSFSPQDLIAGKVDAISAYATNEPYFLNRAGFAYHTYTPRSVGIDFYGDNLFTSADELKHHPARVEAFRKASLRGWQYAMEHPEEIADLIVEKYAPEQPRDFFLFEAKRMAALLRTDLIEIGYMNPGRWRHIAETYADLGLLPRNFSLDGFLYVPETERDLRWLYAMLVLLLVGSAILFYIQRNNRRLSEALAASREAHELLRISEERHRLLADNAADVIWMMNLDGHFTYVSPSVEKLRGYSSAEAMQQSLEEALTPDSLPVASKAIGDGIAAMVAGLPFTGFRAELEQPCKDGSTIWTEVTTSGMRNPAGEFIGLIGVSRDISERKRMEDQIRQLAFYDPLTHLPNRRLLSERLEQAMAASKRSGAYGALMFLDLDNFKSLNDTWGHEVGDLLLTEAATRLKRCLRETDTVARFGGDEFVVLLGGQMTEQTVFASQAETVAKKILAALSATYRLTVQREGTADIFIEHLCTASIGMAYFRGREVSQDDILKRADVAMYQAKNAGGNQIRSHRVATETAPDA